jgi:uncharacterized damage-inducible protein DinB
MDMIEHMHRLFVYDDWANREVLASLRQAETTPARSLKLMGHIFSAERLWLERLEQQKQTLPVWPDFSLEQCAGQAAELPALWKTYLDAANQTGLSRPLSYKNSQGESWTNRRDDILLHVIMHSAYHRGQIAADMRAAGFTPAYTDFVHAVRRGFVE